MFLFIFSLQPQSFYENIFHKYWPLQGMFSDALRCFSNWQCASWVLAVEELLLIITGTLLSFVFLIAAISFVREHSYKCINPCWRALKASCGLPVDFNKKPCQVDQPLVTSLHCLWQIWRLKYTHNSKAPSVLHKLLAFYPGNVIRVGLNFFFFFFFLQKTCWYKMLIWTFAQLNLTSSNVWQ